MDVKYFDSVNWIPVRFGDGEGTESGEKKSDETRKK